MCSKAREVAAVWPLATSEATGTPPEGHHAGAADGRARRGEALRDDRAGLREGASAELPGRPGASAPLTSCTRLRTRSARAPGWRVCTSADPPKRSWADRGCGHARSLDRAPVPGDALLGGRDVVVGCVAHWAGRPAATPPSRVVRPSGGVQPQEEWALPRGPRCAKTCRSLHVEDYLGRSCTSAVRRERARVGHRDWRRCRFPFSGARSELEVEREVWEYLRRVNKKVAADSVDDKPISARNVVVMWARYSALDSDIAGDGGYDVTLGASGQASVFRDGVRIDGRWSADGDSPPRFTSREGSSIRLGPGNTWFEVIPLSANITMKGVSRADRCGTAHFAPLRVLLWEKSDRYNPESTRPESLRLARQRGARAPEGVSNVADTSREIGTLRVKTGLAEMLKGGVIMDVVNAEQAKIAEDAGAVAVMALERVPADIRAAGGVARMADPTMVEEIVERGHDPGHGQVPHRPLRRGAGAAVARRRLHRRVRGADAGRRGVPRQQVGLHRAVRVRLPQPRRGASPHRRGRRDGAHQGRAGHRQRRRGRAPHAHRHRRDRVGRRACATSSSSTPPRTCRRPTSWSSGSPRTASCRS